MSFNNLAQLVWKHTRNAAAESLYLNTGSDITRPVSVYGIVNERCNYKCRYCEYWRLENYVDEMSIDEWKAALQSLAEFVGSFHVQFSGGEPFIKKGFVDLVEWCHEQGLKWGVTTNGSGLTEKNIERVVAARPLNINMSLDSHLDEVHNYARGIEGSLEKITKNITRLIEVRNNAGVEFPVIIKPVLHRLNFRHIVDLVRWAQDLGATAVNIQPVDRWTSETYDELWIEDPKDVEDLNGVIDELVTLRREGAPVLNAETILRAFPAHFREESAPEELMPCRVGMRNYFIRTNGDVSVCWHFPPIGNVKAQSARDIWYGEVGRQRRKETSECEKLCLFTCLSQKTLVDKARMAVRLFGANKTGSKRNSDGGSGGSRTVSLPVLPAVGADRE
ncbi:MAG: radical SAM protein [Phycisphaera sp.]|nr:radical SAM protein [Phycisphaera sp.]